MKRLRRVCVLVMLAVLAGCWQGRVPPKEDSTDTYGWRSEITLGDDANYHRFTLPADFAQWMGQRNIDRFTVFDSAGHVQRCGIMSGSMNDPLGTIPEIIATQISDFDAAACTQGDEPLVCFADRPCSIPEYCAHKQLDLANGPLAGMSSLDEILAAANTAPTPPNCAPDSASATRTCGDGDASARRDYQWGLARQREARRVLNSNRLGGPERLPSFSAGTPSATLNSRSSVASRAGVGVGSQVMPPPQRPLPGFAAGTFVAGSRAAPGGSSPPPFVLFKPTPTEQDAGGYVIRLAHVPGADAPFKFVWNQAPGRGHIGSAKLLAYGADGAPSENRFELQPNGLIETNKPLTVTYLPRSNVSTYRLIPKSDIADLHLDDVIVSVNNPKPFITRGVRTYWLKTDGVAPYSLYLESGHGLCLGSPDARELANELHRGDPDWPAAAQRVSLPAANSRGLWRSLVATQGELATWIYWFGVVGGAALLALLAGVVCWIWLMSRTRR